MIQIGVALSELKNVTVSAVIKVNEILFHLGSHINWLSCYRPVSNTASLVFVYECLNLAFKSGILTVVGKIRRPLLNVLE